MDIQRKAHEARAAFMGKLRKIYTATNSRKKHNQNAQNNQANCAGAGRPQATPNRLCPGNGFPNRCRAEKKFPAQGRSATRQKKKHQSADCRNKQQPKAPQQPGKAKPGDLAEKNHLRLSPRRLNSRLAPALVSKSIKPARKREL